MTTSERFERDVPGLLEELYLGPTPPYRDDILRRTAATRQRPGWTFIERWIPVSAITGRLTAAPRIQWRAVALATLLLIAIAAAAIFVGSQQSRVPPPFGPAANGQIPYVSEGDIYLGDPVTGETKLIVGDAGDDALPQFSPDGTRLAFIRDVPVDGAGPLPIDIYVANADGSGRSEDQRRADPGLAVDRLDSGQCASGCHPRPQPGRPVRRRRQCIAPAARGGRRHGIHPVPPA